MRTITTICMTTLLLSAVAFARLGDTAATVVEDTTTTTSTVPTTDDIISFLSGVWDSIGLGREFSDFSACVKPDDKAGTQLQKAMTLMNGSSASEVGQGMKRLDKVVSNLVNGLKTCNMKDKYTKTINKLVNKFTNPSKLNVSPGSSITVEGINVYAEISTAIAACSIGSFDNCGNEIGDAMGKVFYGQDNATSTSQASQINAIPNNTWTAADSTEFSSMDVWTFKKKHLGLRKKKNTTIANDSETDSQRRNLQTTTIPASFDSRTKWPGCVQAIRNQANCGGCWAFAASEVLSDRFCISSNKSVNLVMSTQFLISCDTSNFGCNGGYLDSSWSFIENSGDVTDTCYPYASGNAFVPACSTFKKCADGKAMRKYYAKINSTNIFYGVAAIQQEIMKNGPIEAAMEVYSDFMSYKSGIYATTSTATYLGFHAIKIIGWGQSSGVNYWIIANSWGTTWGESGFFRMKFGSSTDKFGIAGLPDLTRS